MRKNGFTLIELIVVLTIAFILMSGATISYNRFNEEKKLNQEATKLAETLKLAQIRARTGEVGASICSDVTGYEVTISSTQNILNLCCSATCLSSVTVNTLATNITADSGYLPAVAYRMNTINHSSGMTQLFQVAQDGTHTAIPIDTTRIKIKHTILGQCIDIKMNAVGTVTMTGRYTNGC